MDTNSIIAELLTERDRLDRAIAVLQGKYRPQRLILAGAPARKRRRLSGAARRKIGASMKKRWDERKRTTRDGEEARPTGTQDMK